MFLCHPPFIGSPQAYLPNFGGTICWTSDCCVLLFLSDQFAICANNVTTIPNFSQTLNHAGWLICRISGRLSNWNSKGFQVTPLGEKCCIFRDLYPALWWFGCITSALWGESSLKLKIPILRWFWRLIDNWDSRSKRTQGHKLKSVLHLLRLLVEVIFIFVNRQNFRYFLL